MVDVNLEELTHKLQDRFTDMLFATISEYMPANMKPATTPTKTSKALEDVKALFPEDLENLLSFEEKDDYVIIKPRQFLGSENFSRIASVVRQARGEYVSAGKMSHFKIPKKA